MSKIVIQVENISKQYRLGTVGTGSLMHDLNRSWHRIRGKEDPYLQIGESNDRTQKGLSEYVWALRDINFEVQQGDVLGIIGRNGAGKSTLLKILSRTTTPTTGQIKIKGRIASLLEVGTGFHPELSGRENIFLNGAILGMTRNEIKRKFDEIVDFAGVERYIDTPVKRYSSGMYVRLAFGVAAHLEPEILIVDEVLAVGDAEFQKKALGKMKDVSSREGRTVLFVSHNMGAIENLCNRSLLMKNGTLFMQGQTNQVLNEYLKENDASGVQSLDDLVDRKGNGEIRFSSIKFLDQKDEDILSFKSGNFSKIRLNYKFPGQRKLFQNCRLSIAIKQGLQPLIVLSSELTIDHAITLENEGYMEFIIDKLPLSLGLYDLTVFIESSGAVLDWFTIGNYIEVVDGDYYGSGVNYPKGWEGKTVLIDHRLIIKQNVR